MNIERIDNAIELMQNAKALDMRAWQGDGAGDIPDTVANSIDELHSCGNTACFAGYVALSPMFKEWGGEMLISGKPYYADGFGEVGAIAAYLEISNLLAHDLIHGAVEFQVHGFFSQFYDKLWRKVTPQDVIDKLKAIKRGELQ